MARTRMPFRTARNRYVAITAGTLVLALGATACSGSGGSTTAGSEKTASSSAAAAKPTAPTEAAQTAFTAYTSAKSFDETVSALKKSVASSGMMVLGDLNQAGALKSTGLSLKGAHTFFVGNPAKGKMFFQQDPAIGSVIPLSMYAWADSAGTAHIGYFDPAALFQAVDAKLVGGGAQMKMAADKIAQGATK
jgi:uncharacterized protein (DUF302 family)